MILEPKKIVCHYSPFFSIYLPWSDGTGSHVPSFGMLSFKPAFSLSFFTFIKRLFSSSLLSIIRERCAKEGGNRKKENLGPTSGSMYLAVWSSKTMQGFFRQRKLSISSDSSGFLLHAKLFQLCPTLCDPMDYSPPGSSVHGILQVRMLEWVAILFFRGSSQLRDWTWVSHVAGRFFTIEPSEKLKIITSSSQ